ncbi:hypothetical protein ACFW04_007572 [Cataglyphis niger]
MYRLLTIFIYDFIACCDEPERIIGGDIAAIGQFKYQVSLQSYGEHICGGTIISSTHILTAAHCVDDDFYTNDMVRNRVLKIIPILLFKYLNKNLLRHMNILDIYLLNWYYFYHLSLIHLCILLFSILFSFCINIFYFNLFSQLTKLFNLQIVITGTNSPRIGGEKHDIKCIRIHPEYTGEKETGWKDDIAVITLKKPIKANDVQGPIPLASKNYINGGKRGIVSGWGRTKTSGSSSEILRWLSVNVLSQERCLQGHKNPRTNENQICTLEKVGKGACQGDSGGPLVVDGEVIGVVSWVLPCALGISDVYTNVHKYLDFIEESQLTC